MKLILNCLEQDVKNKVLERKKEVLSEAVN